MVSDSETQRSHTSDTQSSQQTHQPCTKGYPPASGSARATTRAKKRPPPRANTEEDEDDDEDEDEPSHVLLQKSRKNRSSHDKLSVDDEQEAMDWFREHPALYAKKSTKYLDTGYKTRIYRAKANEMGIHPDTLKLWCTSMRTRWGKLARKKSGEEATQGDLTEREQWIYDNFSFLRGHVSRQAKLGGQASTSRAVADVGQVMAAIPLDEEDVDVRLERALPLERSRNTPLTSPVASITPTAEELTLKQRLEESMELSLQLAGRLAARPKLTAKEKSLQSLYDTISAWMQDYTEDEFVELSKCVWDKLYSIRQARVARQQRDGGPSFQPAAGVQQATTQAPQQGYHPPPTSTNFYPSLGQTPLATEATCEALHRQIVSLQAQVQELSGGRREQAFPSQHTPQAPTLRDRGGVGEQSRILNQESDNNSDDNIVIIKTEW